MKGDIGHYTDGNSAPLVHCVRLLSASFLLTGEKGGEFLFKTHWFIVSLNAQSWECAPFFLSGF